MEEAKQIAANPGIDSLVKLVDILRGEEGCPWDRRQTAKSMSVYLIEEMYELVDAIESKPPREICEEMGDVLFHIIFITRLFEEQGLFGLKDVAAAIIRKMIRRHPHVFGTKKVDSTDEVKKQWQQIKQAERKSNSNAPGSVLDSIPVGLPALTRAYRISKRAVDQGFEWDNREGVLGTAEEEWAEFRAELAKTPEKETASADAELEFGDLLFTLVNVARFIGIHPETSLSRAIHKFEKRFRFMEKTIASKGRSLESITRNEMEALWGEAKHEVG